VFPVDKKLGAELDGREEVVISPAVILFVSRPLGRLQPSFLFRDCLLASFGLRRLRARRTGLMNSTM
jgi:hypothetical protein